MLRHCESHGIGFITWFPLAAGGLVAGGGSLLALSRARGVSPPQLTLAWLLRRSPVAMPIPGTSNVRHLEENVAAATVELDDEEFFVLDRESLGVGMSATAEDGSGSS